MGEKAREALAGFYALIEARLKAGRPWVLGETYSVSDPYLMVVTGWMLRRELLAPDRIPLSVAHHARVAARPAAQRALRREAAAA